MNMLLTFLNDFSSKINRELIINKYFHTLDIVWSYTDIEEGV